MKIIWALIKEISSHIPFLIGWLITKTFLSYRKGVDTADPPIEDEFKKDSQDMIRYHRGE